MRQAFAHEAVLSVDSATDLRALGAAVTIALCGSCDHEPPCPLAPHFSHAERADDGAVHLRVLFATEPESEGEVRAKITAALEGAEPQESEPNEGWRLESSVPSPVLVDEADHADRLCVS